MNALDLVSTAAASLRRNTSRSLLTILGIVIGVGAVIVMLSVGQGAQNYILGQVSSLGADSVFVESGGEDEPTNPYVPQTLTLDDVDALRDSGAFVAVTANLMASGTVTYGESAAFSQVTGVTEEELEVSPADLAAGRFFDADDVDSAARIAVLGKETAENLFGESDAVGEMIRYRNVSLRVVGVFDEQGTQFFTNLDKVVYVPVTTLQRMMDVDHVNFIAARAADDIEITKETAREVLLDQHNGEEDFRIASQEDAVQIIGAVGTTLSALLASIAAISLIVGGIGIMNIMLVAVTERTREIGLRKALGATYAEILRQFLLEAVFLTLAGGVLGILGGVAVTVLQGIIVRQFIEGWTPTVPPLAVVLAVVVSTIVGLVFGIYPARRAAKLDPIEALRYE